MSLHAGKMGARCQFALRSAGTTSPALNPSSARDERGSEVAFPPVHGVVEAGSKSRSPGAPSHPAGEDHPSYAVSCEWEGTCQHRVNSWAVWGGSNPLNAFWKDERFISRAVHPPKGVRRLTFHPCFFTSAFSFPLLGCWVPSNCFAPPQKQPKGLQWVNNCCIDHLQSFGILLPPEARLMDGGSLTL